MKYQLIWVAFGMRRFPRGGRRAGSTRSVVAEYNTKKEAEEHYNRVKWKNDKSMGYRIVEVK